MRDDGKRTENRNLGSEQRRTENKTVWGSLQERYEQESEHTLLLEEMQLFSVQVAAAESN